MSTTEGRLDRENPDDLLNARLDPSGSAFGTHGGEAGSDLNWFKMVRARVAERAASSSRYRWWVLWALLTGLFSLNFTFTVFIVALPKVAGEFHTNVTILTWTMVGPLLAYGLAAPVLGKTGDIFGHRRLYLLGLVGAVVSAILTALAPNVITLLLARTLDGIQGAATGTASGAIVNMVFSKEERVKAMGWWSLIGAGGPVIGVSVGSPIIAAFGWRALFWFQCVLLIVAIVVVAAILPRTRDSDEEKAKARAEFRRMDWIGSWTLSLSVSTLMLGLSLGSIAGWSSWIVVGSFVVCVLGLAAFIVRITTAENPLIPAHYFRTRNFVWPMVVRACGNFAYFGAFFMFPLLMEQGFGYSIAAVGGLAVFRPITFSLCSPIAGYVAMRIGERRSAIIGTFALFMSLALFAALSAHSGAWVVAIALSLSGFGMGVAMPSSSSVMASAVKSSEFGVMSAAQMLAMQVGEVAGIQTLETVQQALVHRRHLNQALPGPELLATFRWPFVIGAAVGLVGFAASFLMRSVPRPPREAATSQR